MRRHLLVATLLVLFGAPIARAQVAAPPQPWPPRKGETFPGLELLDLAGQRVALESLRGKVLLVEAVALGDPKSQAYAGGNLRGGFGGVSPDMEALSVGEMFGACGVDRASPDLVHVKVLLRDLTGARAPTADEARAWATHFKLEARPGTLLLIGDERFVRPETTRLVPGFWLVDRNLVVVSDSTGARPTDDLMWALLPAAAEVLAAGGGASGTATAPPRTPPPAPAARPSAPATRRAGLFVPPAYPSIFPELAELAVVTRCLDHLKANRFAAAEA